MMPEANGLISGMTGSAQERERLSCAIQLIQHQGLEVQQAYKQSLSDPSERVVRIACMQLAYRSDYTAVAPIYKLLDHHSWETRIVACRALLVLQAVNSDVVNTLENLRNSPEAASYDADIESIRSELQYEYIVGSGDAYGTLSFLLSKAREAIK